MTWFAFSGYPTIDVAGAQEKTLVAWGFHGYGTEALANAHPNSVNPLQVPIVGVIENDYKVAKATGAQPGGPNSNLANPKSALGAAGLGGIDLLHGFQWGNILLRVGEVLLGIVLVGVGIARITGTDNVISTALKVVK